MKNRIYAMLLIVPLLVSCNRVGGERSTSTSKASMPEKSVTEGNPVAAPPVKNAKQTVHVFIENSGSMNGYINQTSNFQEAIGNALAKMQMNNSIDSIHVYYINSSIKRVKCFKTNADNEVLYKFVQKMLQKEEFTTSGTHKKDPGTASTDLNKIIKLILDSHVGEDNTSILISDCIYSLDDNNQSSLSGCKNLTMLAFGQKVKDNPKLSLSTNVIQFTSYFKGKYWTYKNPNGNRYVSLDCNRPYYICIIGTDANVQKLNEIMDVTSLDGYLNQYTISNKDVSQSKYTVLENKYCIGKFRRANKNCHSINTIKFISNNSKGQFGLSIAVDLKNFSMSEADKLDTANYFITKGNYVIESVEKIDLDKLNLADKDLVIQNNCTHLIVLSCTGYPSDIEVSIKRRVPTWVKKFSSEDDSSILYDENEQKKTYGIEYFVKGISEAYTEIAKEKGLNNDTKDNLITFSVKITK